jgi:sugar phosphate isomerase/epimerase
VPAGTCSSTCTSRRTTARRRAAGRCTGEETFAGLQEIDDDGWVVVEAFGGASPELAAATKIWRRMFESEEQLARDGAAFIRAGLSF